MINAYQTPPYRQSTKQSPLAMPDKTRSVWLSMQGNPPLGVSKPFSGQPAVLHPSEPLLQDRFLDPKYNLSVRKAVTFFLGGFILTFTGRAMFNQLTRKGGVKEVPYDHHIILKDEKNKINQFQIWLNFNQALSSIYRIIQTDPSQGNALLAYAGSCALGYLSGNVVQGTKEAWVRRQETRIRAHLIDKLQNIVRQSIRNKSQLNNDLKEELRGRILVLLNKHGIANPAELLQDVPIVESLAINQRFFYEPTHRTLNTGDALRFSGLTDDVGRELTESDVRVQEALLFGFGAFTGFVVNGFVKLLKAKETVISKANRPVTEVFESIQLKDTESWCMAGVKSRRNFAVMAGFFAMSAVAGLGQTLLDGLKEIEVTRLNARTELDYQTHNWLTQDPAYHNIAERETAQNDLLLLERDLPRLKYNPDMLRQRVRTILANVGRNSAPPYYPMTPMVGLVEARA